MSQLPPARMITITSRSPEGESLGEINLSVHEAGEGPAVVLISTDLDEVEALADRLFVMSRGRLVPVPDDERTREGIGRLMLGAERG